MKIVVIVLRFMLGNNRKYITALVAAALYIIPTFCTEKKPELKDYWKDIDFGRKQLEQVVQNAYTNYIDRHEINSTLAWAEASRYALLSLPANLQLYPEGFFQIRNDFLDDEQVPVPGKDLKIHPDDKFIIFVPDLEEYEKLRDKKETEKNDKELSDQERDERVKELVELERKRKEALTKAWKKTGFKKTDFERVMAWIKANRKKYSQAPKGKDGKPGKTFPYKMKSSYVAAANGFLSSLDPHCGLFSAARWEEQIQETQDSSFEGIGALLRGGGSSPTLVENPLEGRPAVKAGLRAGDEIVKVDEHEIDGWPLSKVVSVIRGKQGSKVTLFVKRKGYKEQIPITIVRQRIDIKNVSSKFIRNHKSIGYIKLTGFTPESTEDIIDHYEKLVSKNKNMRGLILDLRNNPGGLLKEAISISDLFITDGVIVSVKNPGYQQSEQVHRAKMYDLTKLPIVVLVNARSASASEIVASAIQDHRRGLVIGDRSFGKASVQQLFPNRGGLLGRPDYYIKLTVSRYYAPSGRTIQVTGVVPDVYVSTEENGYFPYQFREQDLWNHLGEIKTEYTPPQKKRVDKLRKWVDKQGTAEKYIEQKKGAAIKPDVQLQRAADYLEAMIAVE